MNSTIFRNPSALIPCNEMALLWAEIFYFIHYGFMFMVEVFNLRQFFQKMSFFISSFITSHFCLKNYFYRTMELKFQNLQLIFVIFPDP